MPIYKQVNQKFFKKWSPKMAYVLGFFAADGNMIRTKRGNHYISFYSCDKKILEDIKTAVKSGHKIYCKNSDNKPCYQIQIGSKEMFADLIKLGLTPRKSLTLDFPKIPEIYLKDFVRGYFDGDGNVWKGIEHPKRKTSKTAIRAAFTSGSARFLSGLKNQLKNSASIDGSLIKNRSAFRLQYAQRASLFLYRFMYTNATLYLPRKRRVFEEFFNLRV